ncbi:Uncharacterised protein [uncultured archaeon]|nr:Uncharacterised protein [uncultured archaeon]
MQRPEIHLLRTVTLFWTGKYANPPTRCQQLEKSGVNSDLRSCGQDDIDTRASSLFKNCWLQRIRRTDYLGICMCSCQADPVCQSLCQNYALSSIHFCQESMKSAHRTRYKDQHTVPFADTCQLLAVYAAGQGLGEGGNLGFCARGQPIDSSGDALPGQGEKLSEAAITTKSQYLHLMASIIGFPLALSAFSASDPRPDLHQIALKEATISINLNNAAHDLMAQNARV